jgi:hypothetical protein
LTIPIEVLPPTPPPSTVMTDPPELGPEAGPDATGSGDPMKAKVAEAAEEAPAREIPTGATPFERASGASHVASAEETTRAGVDTCVAAQSSHPPEAAAAPVVAAADSANSHATLKPPAPPSTTPPSPSRNRL